MILHNSTEEITRQVPERKSWELLDETMVMKSMALQYVMMEEP